MNFKESVVPRIASKLTSESSTSLQSIKSDSVASSDPSDCSHGGSSHQIIVELGSLSLFSAKYGFVDMSASFGTSVPRFRESLWSEDEVEEALRFFQPGEVSP